MPFPAECAAEPAVLPAAATTLFLVLVMKLSLGAMLEEVKSYSMIGKVFGSRWFDGG